MTMWPGDSEKPIPLKLQDCEEKCSFEIYSKMVKPILPRDEDRECSVVSAATRTVIQNSLILFFFSHVALRL